MHKFIETFKQAANEVLAECPNARVEWISDVKKPKETLIVHRDSMNGFGIKMECETYGLYPYAGEWWGAPWDVTVWHEKEFSESIKQFLKSILSHKGRLLVYYSNGKPYKWNLKFLFEGEWVTESCGSSFMRWFGKKTSKEFHNNNILRQFNK